jgi:NO-binding membrane sensor protein with MHYT domain
MNSVVTTSYQASYIALSLAISILGSFVGLTAARNIRSRDGQLNMVNTVSAGLALGGIGVWSMHFIGMLSLKLDLATGYAAVETLISLIAAVTATSLALAFVSKNPKNIPRLIGAGTVLGLGVAFMHYLGMAGMRFGGYFSWDYGIVAVSVFIAVAAATVALWLALNTQKWQARLMASGVMGVAVSAMHYTGMSAAEFICTTVSRQAVPVGFGVLRSFELPLLVSVTSIGLAAIISIDQVSQRVLAPAR